MSQCVGIMPFVVSRFNGVGLVFGKARLDVVFCRTRVVLQFMSRRLGLALRGTMTSHCRAIMSDCFMCRPFGSSVCSVS